VVRPPRKREYERRSGTGRGREQQKGGRGAHAFGNEAQEAQDAEKDPASAEPAVDGEDGAAAEDGEPAAASEPVVEAEPEPPTMTMEEFLAQRAAARANAQLFGEVKAVRKVETDLSGARRGKEDLGIWGGFGASKEEAEKQKEQRSHAKKQVLDVAFKNAALEQSRDRDDYDRPPRGGRGGRGERDGGRGGRGRGRGDYGDRRAEGSARPAYSGGRGGGGGRIDLSDSNAFPAL